MKSFLKEITSLEEWDYYKRTDEFKLKQIENWCCQHEHKDFIKNYLKLSGKIKIIKFFKIEFEQFTRAIHTNGVFFLGSLFYEKLDFKNKINFTRDGRDEFYFMWFLSSLVHDFRHDMEKRQNEDKKLTNDIDSFITEFDVENNLLKKPINNYSKNMKELIAFIPEYYERRIDGKEGRSNESRIDHGITSGLILYDSLVKNRKEKQEEHGDIDTKHNLYWGDELDKFYAIAAHSIAVHNMRKEDLKFSITEEPFLFLFMLADTIEPSKYFKCANPKEVLEDIAIEFHSKTKFTITNLLKLELDFTEYAKRIENLQSFLKVKVDSEEKNKITIIIEQ